MSLDKEQSMMELVKIATEDYIGRIQSPGDYALGRRVKADGPVIGYRTGYEDALQDVLSALSTVTVQELIKDYFERNLYNG